MTVTTARLRRRARTGRQRGSSPRRAFRHDGNIAARAGYGDTTITTQSITITAEQLVAVGNDRLQISLLVLADLGGIAHHLKLVARAKELKLNDKNLDLATAIWNDTRKNGEASSFRFLRHGVFCLASYQGDTSDEAVKALVPARKSGSKELTPEQLATKLAAAEALLESLKAQIADSGDES